MAVPSSIKKNKLAAKKQIREEIEKGVRNIAQVFGISNRDAQAAIWIAYRGSAN